MINNGNYKTGETVYLPFNTFDADGASVTVTDLVAGDIKIHKDGGLTQRSSAAGITVSIDFDGITGNHLIAIDLSDNTDAGFYVAGSDYEVRVEGITVATQTINAWVGIFSIENRLVEVDVTKIGGDAQSATDLKDFADVGYDPATNKIQGVVLTDTCTTNTDQRGTDSANTVVPDVAGTAPTAIEIRTEIDNNSTQLAAVKAKTDNMPEGIQKNVALTNFEFFMADSSDNVTGKTGLTIIAQRSINGGSLVSMANSATEISNGLYKINLAQADTNGDLITYRFSATGAVDTIVTFKTSV